MTGFVFWMLVASGLGFVKSLGLASILAKGDFGNYGARFGLATFAAALVSLGIIERTIKAYPRGWAEGHVEWIRRDAGRVVRTVALRFLVIGAAALVVAAVLGRYGVVVITSLDVALTVGLAMGAAWLNLLASVYRAAGSRQELVRFQIQRTACALACAVVGGWAFGWSGALAGDIVASIASITWSNARLRRLYAVHAATQPLGAALSAPAGVERGHHALYVANLLSSSTVQTDRTIVLAAVGAELAGTYGVVMLIPAVGQMLVNVIVQFIGPLIIKFAHARHRDDTRISNVGLQSVLLTVFALALAGGVYLGRYLPYAGDFLTKYALSGTALMLAAALAAGQIYAVLEFHLIAHDRERQILVASVTSTAIFFVLYAVAAATTVRIEWFLAAGVAARLVQVAILRHTYRRLRRADGSARVIP